ncbi:hypothetical protein PAMA_014206 [Pampus argenteus]
MQRSATDGVVLSESLSEDTVHADPPVRSGESLMSAGPCGSSRSSRKLWPVVALSVLLSSAAVAAAGSFSALLYPVLAGKYYPGSSQVITELRAERVRGEDGTEVRMLGFWSILVLSVLVGWICCVFSWTLTYLDSYRPGTVFPTPLTLTCFRDVLGHGLHMGYGVAVLNGIMAMLTVIWSLS